MILEPVGKVFLRSTAWHHLKAACNVTKVFSKKITGTCIVPVTCSSDPRILLVQHFAKQFTISQSSSYNPSGTSSTVFIQYIIEWPCVCKHSVAFFHWKEPLELRSPCPKHNNVCWKLKLRKDSQTYKIAIKRAGGEKGKEDR